MKIKLRTIIQVFAYYLIPLFLLGNVLIGLNSGAFIEHDIKELGSNAFLLLFATIFMITPLLPKKTGKRRSTLVCSGSTKSTIVA